MTVYELADLLIDRFGPEPADWAFECPACHDVATGADFLAAAVKLGRPYAQDVDVLDHLGVKCIGRHIGVLRAPEGRWRGRGCNWVAYGLIDGPAYVQEADGTYRPMFHPATTVPVERGSLECVIAPHPFTHPGQKLTAGAGAWLRLVTARRTYPCDYGRPCTRPIEVGEQYVLQTVSPRAECNEGGPWRSYREHIECRYPPVRPQ